MSYFRNPNRGKVKPNVGSAYEPEYKRLGAQVVEYPIRDEDDFIKMNKQNLKEKEESDFLKRKDALAKEAVSKFRNGEIKQEELEAILHDIFPRQKVTQIEAQYPIVSSGQDKDLLWVDGLAKAESEDVQKAALELVEENQDYEYEEDEEDEEDESDIMFDEVELPLDVQIKTESGLESDLESESEEFDPDLDPEDEIDQDNEEHSDQKDGFSFSSLNNNDYVLIYNDSVLDIGSLESIKTSLLSIVETKDVSIDEIVVLKRVSVKMGLFVDE